MWVMLVVLSCVGECVDLCGWCCLVWVMVLICVGGGVGLYGWCCLVWVMLVVFSCVGGAGMGVVLCEWR